MVRKLKSKSGILIVSVLLVLTLVGSWLAYADNDEYWTDINGGTPNFDVSWYNNILATQFKIDTPAQLAGVAWLVKNGGTLAPDGSCINNNLLAGTNLSIIENIPDLENIEDICINGFDGVIIGVDENISQATQPFNTKIWEPIGTLEQPFRGTLQGMLPDNGDNTITIDRLRLEDNRSPYVGLVGFMEGATVGGFTFTNTTVNINRDSETYVGTAVGKMVNDYVNDKASTVYDIKVEASSNYMVKAGNSNAYVGGIVGAGEGNIFTSEHSSLLKVEDTSNMFVGGIVGQALDNDFSHINNFANILLELEEELEENGEIPLDEAPGENEQELEEAPEVENELENEAINEIDSERDNEITETTMDESDSVLSISSLGTSYKVLVINNVENNGQIEVNGAGEAIIGGIAAHAAVDIIMNDEESIPDPDIIYEGTIQAKESDRILAGGIIGKASGQITFSEVTSNQGQIEIDSNQANLAVAGGLIGLFEQPARLINIGFTNEGTITNDGGTNVYTGGIIGWTEAHVAFAERNQNIAEINASGSSDVYTGGIIGYVRTSDVGELTNVINHGEIHVNATGTIGMMEKIATGGSVGYFDAINGQVSNLGFEAEIVVTGGNDASTFTGGMVGYLEKGSISNVIVGHEDSSKGTILADGSIGGVVGFMEENTLVEDIILNQIQLTAKSDNGVIGGIVGKSKGLLKDLFVKMDEGTPPAPVKPQVTINAAIVGDKKADTLIVGGLAGFVLPEATIGEAGSLELVNGEQIDMEIKSKDSYIGGMIGYNQSPTIYLELDTLNLDVETSNVYVGGLVGLNNVLAGNIRETEEVPRDLIAKNIRINTKEDNGFIGGLYGHNVAETVYNFGQHIFITSDGNENKLGGAVGHNTGSFLNSDVQYVEIVSSGEKAEVGGIAGRTENDAVIANTTVLAETLITARGKETRAGGIVGYAEQTEILNTLVRGALPGTEMIRVQASNECREDETCFVSEVYAGGIAGEINNSLIRGNAKSDNVNNVFISNGAKAVEAEIGGIAGHAEGTRIERLVAKNVVLRVNGVMTKVGGMVGVNTGEILEKDETNPTPIKDAIIKDSYLLDLSLVVNNTASSSVVGGMVGKNKARDYDQTITDPRTAISSIQGSRSVGRIEVNSPNSAVGGLVGENNSFIANNSIADKLPVISTGANSELGGLVGKNNGTIYYTYSNANLTIEGKGTVAGGLVGENTGSVLSSYIDIDVTAKNYSTSSAGDPLYLGGLVGKNKGTIDKSYTNAKITANAPNTVVGGLVGLLEEGTITSSYVGKEVRATAVNSYAGGFIGEISTDNTIRVSSSYSAAEVIAARDYAGGFAGLYENSSKELLSKNYYVKDEVFNKDLPDFAEGKHRWLNAPTRLRSIHRDTLSNRVEFPSLSGWDFGNTWRYASINAPYKYPELNRLANSGSENTGSDEENDGDIGNIVNANINWYVENMFNPKYQITTEAELAGLAAIVNGMVPGIEPFDFLGRTIEIVNPIHVQSKQWVPIGHKEGHAFRGTFDGRDQLIHGLTVQPQHSYTGLFGEIGVEGTVKNINIEAESVIGNDETGVIAAINNGTVKDVKVTLLGPVNSEGNHTGAMIKGKTVGGIIGRNTASATVNNLTLTLDYGSRIEAGTENAIVGGVIGENHVNIRASSYTLNGRNGSIGSDQADTIVGGIIGQQTGDVTGLDVNITQNYAISTSGIDNILGGVIGHYISGKANNITVTFKDGTLNATGQGSTVGGVIGYSELGNEVENITVTTDDTELDVPHITGTAITGGMIGYKEGKGNNSFDVEKVSTEKIGIATHSGTNENAIIGGAFGKLTNTAVQNGYFDGSISANIAFKLTAGGIVGETVNSILYDMEVLPSINTNATGTSEHIVGGIAGIIEATDDTINNRDAAHDFGMSIPLYKGIYNGNVYEKEIIVSNNDAGNTNKSHLYVGGLVGKNTNASIYFSHTSTKLVASHGNTVYVGGVVGFNNEGIIVHTKAATDIEADASVNYHVGGFVGRTEKGEIHHSNVNDRQNEAKVIVGTAKGTDETTFVGGFVGSAGNTWMTYAYSDIPVEVNCTNLENVIQVGGFAGALDDAAMNGFAQLFGAAPQSGLLERVYAKGDVYVAGKVMSYAGGFVGYVDRYQIKNAYATGNIDNTGFDTRSGGFAAVVERNAVITNALANTASIKGKGTNNATRAYAGGFAALNDGKLNGIQSLVDSNNIIISNIRDVNDANVRKNSLVAYEYSRSNITTADVSLPYGEWSIEPDATFLLKAREIGSVYTDPTALLAGNDKELTAIVLLYNDNVSELLFYQLFNREVDRLEINQIKLENDIEMDEGEIWLPIAEFKEGTVFEGNNKTISNLNIRKMTESGYTIHHGIYPDSDDDREYTGLILKNEGIVRKLELKGVTVEGYSNAGIIAGLNTNEISAITINGTATITAQHQLGGIAGINAGTIENIEVLEQLALNGVSNVGGISGINNGLIGTENTIIDIKALSIKAENSAGGIAGVNGEDKEIINTTIGALDIQGRSAEVSMLALPVTFENFGGVAGVNNGTITDAVLNMITIAGENQLGGITGVNLGDISNITVTDKVTILGNNEIGGVTGVNEGNIYGILDINDLFIEANENIGGVAGINTASGTIAKVKLTEVTLYGETNIGGVAGRNNGAIGSEVEEEKIHILSIIIDAENNAGGIAGVNEEEKEITNASIDTLVINGKLKDSEVNILTLPNILGNIGGATGINNGIISGITINKATITGEDQLGGIAGQNSGEIASVLLNDLTIEGNDNIGGIAGINLNEIMNGQVVAGFLSNRGSNVGGISGSNDGKISRSFVGGTITSANPLIAIVGGITGENTGEIEQSFSYADISVEAKVAKVGGIAGISSKDITNVYNAGRIVAKGTGTENVNVWSGGIVGHATAGSIKNGLNYGEVVASIDEKIVPQQSYFGGIVGQNSGATIENSFFNKQMLKANTGYYDVDGKRIGGDVINSGAMGMLSSALTTDTLPLGLAPELWEAVPTFYPQLKGFNESVTKVSTAAVILNDYDVINRVNQEISLSEAVEWAATPSIPANRIINGRTVLTISENGVSRTIVINEPALLFIEKAAQPTVTTDPATETFQEKITVTLSTTEPGGLIYYTLDESNPIPNVGTTALYTEPLEITETKTLKAIVIAEDKEPSDVLTRKWTKQAPGGGIGGGPAPLPPAPVPSQVTLNDKPINGEIVNGVINAVFTLSDLETTNNRDIVVAGKDRSAIGYAFRFDNTVKEQAVKENKNIIVDLPLAKIVVTPSMLANMTENLEIKVTQNNDQAIGTMKNIATSVNASLLGEGQGVTVESNLFKTNKKTQYVQTNIPVPTNVHANNITAIVLKGPDGNWTTIPWKLETGNDGAFVNVQLSGEGNISFIHNTKVFNDVADSFWGKQSISEASSKLFVLGKGNDAFDPENNVTRAEYPTILLRVAGLMNKSANNSFTDVGTNAWYNRSVAIASDLGIVNGKGNGSYAPNETLTRIEGMTMVGRLLESLELAEAISEEEVDQLLSTFADVASIPEWARTSAALTIKHGIILGENNHVNPNNQLTRAQAAAIAMRIDKLITER